MATDLKYGWILSGPTAFSNDDLQTADLQFSIHQDIPPLWGWSRAVKAMLLGGHGALRRSRITASASSITTLKGRTVTVGNESGPVSSTTVYTSPHLRIAVVVEAQPGMMRLRAPQWMQATV